MDNFYINTKSTRATLSCLLWQLRISLSIPHYIQLLCGYFQPVSFQQFLHTYHMDFYHYERVASKAARSLQKLFLKSTLCYFLKSSIIQSIYKALEFRCRDEQNMLDYKDQPLQLFIKFCYPIMIHGMWGPTRPG